MPVLGFQHPVLSADASTLASPADAREMEIAVVSIEDTLFAQFADALNEELATDGAKLRIARRPPLSGTGLTLIDEHCETIGWLPEHTDAAIILAIERILASRSDPRGAFAAD